ncbi:hypothetical protein GCM10020000_77690 [Streptomyces olivoverticillatus]
MFARVGLAYAGAADRANTVAMDARVVVVVKRLNNSDPFDALPGKARSRALLLRSPLDRRAQQ